MPKPQSLLAEMRALDAKRAQGGLLPAEEERLAELRAAAGVAPAPASGPGGFDVNAAAAAIREVLAPGSPPAPEAGAAPPIPEDPVAPPPALEGAAEPFPADGSLPAGLPVAAEAAPLGEVPADWSDWQEPALPGSPPTEEPPAAGTAEPAAEGAWDPATEALWESYAREHGWDPASPWDPAEAAAHWAGFVRTMGWSASPDSGTASWDLSGELPGPAEPAPSVEPTLLPDEQLAGMTAQWSLAQVIGTGSPLPEPLTAQAESEPESVVLDELELASEGSFGAIVPARVEPERPPPPALAWPPAAEPEIAPPVDPGAAGAPSPAALRTPAFAPDAPPEPVELGDDEILEVGDEVTEVVPAEPAAGEIVAELAPPPPASPTPETESAPPPPPDDAVPLETLTIDEVPLVEEAPATTGRIVAGLHRVVLHTIEGQVMRGVVQDPDLLAAAVQLAPQPSAAAEPVPAERLRAIFFMLAPGEAAPEPAGLRVRVTFRDGRQVAGFSPDYAPEASGFFMIPADSRTNTARIWVYRSAVRQVAVS